MLLTHLLLDFLSFFVKIFCLANFWLLKSEQGLNKALSPFSSMFRIMLVRDISWNLKHAVLLVLVVSDVVDSITVEDRLDPKVQC